MQLDEETLVDNFYNFLYQKRKERIRNEKEEGKRNEQIKEEEREGKEEGKTEEKEKTDEEKAKEERIAAKKKLFEKKAEEKYKKSLRSLVEKVVHNIRYKNCLTKYVKVKTASSCVFEGWFKCIDPVGGIVVVVQFDENFSKIERYIFIYECITEMEVVKEGDEKTYKLLTEPVPLSSLYLNDKKRRLILWMEKHKLPVEEGYGGISVMVGCGSKIKISYPYDISDVCGLPGAGKQLLKRVKYLVKMMPDTEEEVNQYEIKPATKIVKKDN